MGTGVAEAYFVRPGHFIRSIIFSSAHRAQTPEIVYMLARAIKLVIFTLKLTLVRLCTLRRLNEDGSGPSHVQHGGK